MLYPISYIHSLTIVPEPIAKVNTLYIHFRKLLARTSGHEQSEQGVFNIPMAPVLTFDSSSLGDVSSSKGVCRACVKEDDEKDRRED